MIDDFILGFEGRIPKRPTEPVPQLCMSPPGAKLTRQSTVSRDDAVPRDYERWTLMSIIIYSSIGESLCLLLVIPLLTPRRSQALRIQVL